MPDPVATTDDPPDDALPSRTELARAVAAMVRVRQAARADSLFGMDDPWPDFVLKMRMLPPQSYGKRFEKYLIDKLGWATVPASEDRGDAVVGDPADGDARWVEIKVSMTIRPDGRVNFVQLRPWQDVDGYSIFVVDHTDRLHRFDLTAEQMKAEIAATGASVAHGTRAVAEANPHAEYAIRFAFHPDDETCARWLEHYEVPSGIPGSDGSSRPRA